MRENNKVKNNGADHAIPLVEDSEWPEGASPYDDDNGRQDNDEAPGEEKPRGLLARFGMEPLSERAVSFANRFTSWFPSGMCLQFSRMAFGAPGGTYNAITSWNNAKSNGQVYPCQPHQAPAGYPVFWSGGSAGHGHVAVSLGNGVCRSTDWPSSTRVGNASINSISSAWGLTFLGFSTQINGVDIPAPRRPRPRRTWTLDLSNIANATRLGRSVPLGIFLKRAVAAEVGRGKMDMNSKRLGSEFRRRYSLVQREYLRLRGIDNPSASDVNGIPGVGSLTWLGERHKFKVRS